MPFYLIPPLNPTNINYNDMHQSQKSVSLSPACVQPPDLNMCVCVLLKVPYSLPSHPLKLVLSLLLLLLRLMYQPISPHIM